MCRSTMVSSPSQPSAKKAIGRRSRRAIAASSTTAASSDKSGFRPGPQLRWSLRRTRTVSWRSGCPSPHRRQPPVVSRSNAADRRQLAKAGGTAVLASATLRCGDSGPDKAHPASVPGRARIRYALPPPPSDRGGLTRWIVACPLAARRWAARLAAVISARVGVRRRRLMTVPRTLTASC